ncbi:MAG: sugar transferase, partial [Thermodesulfobacteriota bacterium]|nr:sugar transferase [Thermodesulfobacteriota bacterium]
LLLTLSKFIIFKVLKKIRTNGHNTRNLLIVGSQTRARQVIEVLEANKATGYMILGCFDVDEEKVGQSVLNDHKVIGLVKNLEAYLRDNIVDELIFAMPLRKLENGDRYIAFAESMGINVKILPDWELYHLMYRPDIAAIRFEDFFGVYTMALQTTPLNEGEMLLKHVGDFLAALALTIILLPVFIVIGIAIKVFSKGSVFYTQERLGMNGRRFMVYKFRTMVEDADELLKELAEMNEADGPAFKIKNDPRIIPYVGTFLRKSSLDELPQLFNVLKTEMSLVGPRPPIPKEVDEYSVWHRRRLSMKPGMTCLWQIAPERNELDFEEWMKLDLQYIDNWSLFNDFKILVLTAKAVLTGAGR